MVTLDWVSFESAEGPSLTIGATGLAACWLELTEVDLSSDLALAGFSFTGAGFVSVVASDEGFSGAGVSFFSGAELAAAAALERSRGVPSEAEVLVAQFATAIWSVDEQELSTHLVTESLKVSLLARHLKSVSGQPVLPEVAAVIRQL